MLCKSVACRPQVPRTGYRLPPDPRPVKRQVCALMHATVLRRSQGSEKSPSWIEGTCPSNAQFVSPPADHVETCLAGLEHFIRDEDDLYPALVKEGLAHARFEAVHPFLDGNGRIGRSLIACVLHHDPALSQPPPPKPVPKTASLRMRGSGAAATLCALVPSALAPNQGRGHFIRTRTK